MENIISYIFSFGIIPALIFGVLGLILGGLFWGRKKNVGDLSIEGEGQLRSEADGLRARINELEGNLSTRDTEVSGLKSSLTAAGTGSAATTAAANDDDETYALEWRNRYLAARVKYLEGRVAEGGTKKKAPAKKKTVAKKTTNKKVVAKKAAPAKKAAKSANDKYYTKIAKYDSRASKSVIDKIVKYCGPSLKSRDASLVACTDEAELDRIVKGFCTKKLGLKTGQNELVAKTCQQMKTDRMKNRAVFYYLAAKSAGKLSVFK